MTDMEGDVNEPTTEAGRALLERIRNLNGRSFPLATARDILAIEAEARATATPGLREHPGENHEFRTVCQTCGEPGYLNVALITPNEVVRIEPRAALSDTPPSGADR